MALRINDELVADEVFHREIVRLTGGVAVEPEQLARLSRTAEQNVILRVLLLQIARQHGLTASQSEIEAERRRQWGSATNTICGTGVHKALEENLLIEKLQRNLTKHVPRPSRMEVEQFYRANPQLFFKPEQVLVAHIVKNVDSFEDESEAQAILRKAEQELADGKPFAAVAERYSDCKGNGGSLGWVERGAMVEDFDAVVFSMRERERSPVFRTVFGLHIAEVQARKAAGVQPFNEVRSELARRIYEEQRRNALDRALAKVRHQAHIVVVPVLSTNQVFA